MVKLKKDFKLYASLCKQFLNEIFFITVITIALTAMISVTYVKSSNYLEESILSELSFIYALACIVVVFLFLGYLYNKKSIDYYYSLPITRKRLFTLHFLGALTTSIIIFLINIGVILLFSINIHLDKLLLVCISLLFIVLITSFLIALSTSKLESMLLIFFMWTLLRQMVDTILNFFRNTLFGFPFSDAAIRKTSSLATFSYIGEMGDAINWLIYILSFVIVSSVLIFFTYYFIEKRKPERIGNTFGKTKLYSIIKTVVVVLILLSFINMNDYSLAKGESILMFLQLFLLGVVCFVLLTFIQKRSISGIFKYIFQFCIVFVVFVGIVLGYQHVKKALYETKIPSKVTTIELEIEKNRFIPTMIKDGVLTQKFEIDEKHFENVLKMHQNIIHYHRSDFIPHSDFKIVYNKNKQHQFIRAYQLDATIALMGPIIKAATTNPAIHFGNRPIYTTLDIGSFERKYVAGEKLQKIYQYVMDHATYTNLSSLNSISFRFGAYRVNIPFSETMEAEILRILNE